jgi:glutathione synthase/RimK-type ligase-like ATP-grasp enzyme
VKCLDKAQDYITKPISDGVVFNIQGSLWSNYTTSIDRELGESNCNYPLSLYQENLNKSFEIRTFYFYGECRSMAIFSQENSQTKTDFRLYDDLMPNRTVPFQLDVETEDKIREFMKTVKLETGSLDFVKTKDGRMVFLEVNPVGQFGMVSHPCNYFIEEKIAQWLIKNDK